MLRNSGIWLISGFLFFGQYFDSTYLALEGQEVKYRAGIHFEIPVLYIVETPRRGVSTEGPILFVEDETLMDGAEGGNFHPVQINYRVGLSQKVGNFEAIIENRCLHPVDGTSGGVKGQEYKLIEVRYHFR